MTTTKVIYETGATSHAVNDLILFTDNTRELAELRDSIYDKMHSFDLMDKDNSGGWDDTQFSKLFIAAVHQYKKEFEGYKNSHIKEMTGEQVREYRQLYLADFPNWKQEHGY